MIRLKEIKSSFLYRFVIYFVFLVIMPILCIWWVYGEILNYYYAENVAAVRQINMENSASLLDSSISAIENVFVALEGNQEVISYLNYTPNKSHMLYGIFKRVHSFCEQLYMMTPYLTSVKIYCDSSLVIYADPFERMERLVLEETVFEKIENAAIKETVWAVSCQDPDEFPQIFAYRKLYTENYFRCIGYMEIQLSPQLFSDYFEMLASLQEDPEAVLALYHGEEELYSTSPERREAASVEEMEPGYEIFWWKKQYRNCLEIPEMGLKVVCTGFLQDGSILHSRNIPSIFISILIMLLLILFLIFFMSIFSLSKRILAFSSFIRYSDPNSLSPFHPETKAEKQLDELDVLIDAYNTLIKENNSLISQIQKMELFTQDARFRALQGQIHPHFIYGTLETIRMTALKNRDREAAAMIYSLSSLIRYSISVSAKPVTLADELEIAEHYLKIQKIRFDDRIDYDFQVEEQLLGMELPAFILQPILENAIVYGVSQTLEKCILNVEACEDEAKITIRVLNTGLPITEKRLIEMNQLLSGNGSPEVFQGKGNGLALNNIKERIAIFFHGMASIHLDLQEGCTAVVITILKE